METLTKMDVDDIDMLGDWTVPETGLDGGDDPLDEAPFSVEELMRLAREHGLVPAADRSAQTDPGPA